MGRVRGGGGLSDIPPFTEAVVSFKDFLRDLGHAGPIVWTYREDFYWVSQSRTWVRWPPPELNAAVAARRFEAGRERGLVEIAAHLRVRASIAATVFAPARDDIQGWGEGFKLSARDPLPEGTPVSNRLLWALHRRRSAYVRFQQGEGFEHLRSRIA
jgi:hypothetical protein